MLLFPDDIVYPPGFSYVRQFISVEEENELISSIRQIKLYPFQFQGFEAKRNVASFGFDYEFSARKLAEGQTIPAEFKPLIQKVALSIGIIPADFRELLITEYPPGAVINWHRDAPPFGIIAGVSLATDCIFRLRPHIEKPRKRNSVVSFTVARRSLYVIRDEARENWQHSIAPVSKTRFSITLRTLKG